MTAAACCSACFDIGEWTQMKAALVVDVTHQMDSVVFIEEIIPKSKMLVTLYQTESHQVLLEISGVRVNFSKKLAKWVPQGLRSKGMSSALHS